MKENKTGSIAIDPKKIARQFVNFNVAAFALCGIEALRQNLSAEQQVFYDWRLTQEFYNFASKQSLSGVPYSSVADSEVPKKYGDLELEERLGTLLTLHRNVICQKPCIKEDRKIPDGYDVILHDSVHALFLDNKDKIILLEHSNRFVRNPDLDLQVRETDNAVNYIQRFFAPKRPKPKCNKTALQTIESRVFDHFLKNDPYLQMISLKENKDVLNWVQNAKLSFADLLEKVKPAQEMIWSDSVTPIQKAPKLQKTA